MKLNFIKYNLLIISFLFVGFLFTACEDDIKLAPNGDYNNIDATYGSLKNITGARDLSTITIFGTSTGTGQLYFELTETASENVTVQFQVDEAALEAYNAANGTSYTMYAANNVTLDNNGVVTIASGAQKSDVVNVTVSSNGGIGNTYALPISATVTIGGVTVSSSKASYIYLVKPYPEIPNSDKGTGIKSILYVEVNDENILNAGEYTMIGSGKPFFDVVNIFAANINYNNETGRAYVNCNENVAYVLKHADQFIRPLQAKGIKVVLSILGNHDEAGVSNLSPEAAVDFARELKSYVDVYGLDGIDFDDEWSAYNSSNPSPGFEAPSKLAAARLVYECRQIMPEKIISFYDWGSYVAGGTVEGYGAGELLDYAYYGLYGNWNSSRMTSITGMQKSQYCPIAFSLDYTYSENGGSNRGGCRVSDATRLRSEGYGISMFYNIKPTRYNYSYIFDELGNVLFDDGVEWTGKVYQKTSTTSVSHVPSYDSYIGTWSATSARGLYYYTPGPWWDWTSVTYTLRVEADVVGQTYKVYGWGETGDDLPFIMNYNSLNGWVEINLPQTVTAPDGSTWTYVGKHTYSTASSRILTNIVKPVFNGYITSSGGFSMWSSNDNYTRIRTMSPIQWDGVSNTINDIYGGLLQDVLYQESGPFVLTKKS